MRVLILAAENDRDSARLAGLVRCHAPTATIVRRATVLNALQELAGEESPHLILVSEPHPDAWRPDQVHKLLSAGIACRWLVCAGPWCESAGRTRSIWPIAIRCRFTEWERCLLRELRTLQGVIAPLPLTASRGERVAADIDLASGTPPRESGHNADRLHVAIDSPDLIFAEMLSEWRTQMGWVASNVDLRVRVFDAEPWSIRGEALLKRCDPERTLVLTDWPTRDMIRGLATHGFRNVASRLDSLASLSEAVQRIAFNASCS